MPREYHRGERCFSVAAAKVKLQPSLTEQSAVFIRSHVRIFHFNHRAFSVCKAAGQPVQKY